MVAWVPGWSRWTMDEFELLKQSQETPRFWEHELSEGFWDRNIASLILSWWQNHLEVLLWLAVWKSGPNIQWACHTNGKLILSQLERLSRQGILLFEHKGLDVNVDVDFWQHFGQNLILMKRRLAHQEWEYSWRKPDTKSSFWKDTSDLKCFRGNSDCYFEWRIRYKEVMLPMQTVRVD